MINPSFQLLLRLGPGLYMVVQIERDRYRGHVLIAHTSNKNLGLSGRRKYMNAPMSEGKAETAMKSRQLWNLNLPTPIMSKGIMAHATAAQRKRPTIQKVD